MNNEELGDVGNLWGCSNGGLSSTFIYLCTLVVENAIDEVQFNGLFIYVPIINYTFKLAFYAIRLNVCNHHEFPSTTCPINYHIFTRLAEQ